MRRSLARFSGPGASNHTPCSADSITITSGFRFSVHTGLELLPKAKALRPDVPVTMITAYGDAETKRKALEGGADALLPKPIDFVMLRKEIDIRVERAA
jgi:CheY-like chemotaxis protein